MSRSNVASWVENPTSAVRQTVTFGPVSSGAPNFLPATSASLSITAQNVSYATPLALTAAQGGNIFGAADVLYAFTSNPTWSGLTASNTNYLYVNAATGAIGSTTLVPIYQYGGTPAVTNGQFTFNIGEMTGYMGNGSTAPATPLVFVGECVTGGSTVTSTIAYAYNGYFDSDFTGPLPAPATLITKNSNLGIASSNIYYVLECTTAESGYSIGDQVMQATTFNNAVGTVVVQTWQTRNTVGFTTGDGSSFLFYNKTTGAFTGFTVASWKYKFIAKRAW